MRQSSKSFAKDQVFTAGLTIAAALALCAGQALGQTSSSSSGSGSSSSKSSSSASSGSSSKTGGSSGGSKTHTNAGAAKKPTTGSSTSSKPLVSGGSVLGGTPPVPSTSTAGGTPGATGDKAAGESGVHVSDYMTVDIFVQDEDLANVLQMLSLQSRKNIIASKDVSASVTANLYGVTFYEALDAILNVNGYGYIEKGNFIYVHTLDEIAQIQAADRKIVSKVITLAYLNANDAAEFVTPLLSEAGSIKTNGDVGDFQIPQNGPTGAEQFALAATLVVFDYPDHIQEIEALLKQLDTRPAQVLVEATILQTALNEANAFGVDFSFINNVNFLDFLGKGGPLGAVGALSQLGTDKVAPANGSSAQAISTGGAVGNFAGPSTFKAAIFADDAAVFIRALDQVGDTIILSNPKLLALNRQPAKVLVGRKLGYLNTTATETSTTQTVEFLDTGTQLTVRPFISNDGMVRMELKPRVSEGVVRTASNATGAAVTIPDEITQEITTNVIVPDGSTIVLGGLFKETTKLNRSQVPVVGDIPILGIAFQGHDDSIDRAEIIFMIKPTIMHDKIMADQGDRAMQTAQEVLAGARGAQLPFSRNRQCEQLNLEAQRLADAGQTEKALWTLDRSLSLNPAQPDAIRLKEKLQGKADLWPTGNVIDYIMTGDQKMAIPYQSLIGPAPAPAKPAAAGPETAPAPAPATPVATAPQASATPVNNSANPVAPTSPSSNNNWANNLIQFAANEPAQTPAAPAPAQPVSTPTAAAQASPAVQPAAPVAVTQTQPVIVPSAQPFNMWTTLRQRQAQPKSNLALQPQTSPAPTAEPAPATAPAQAAAPAPATPEPTPAIAEGSENAGAGAAGSVNDPVVAPASSPK